VPAWFRLGRSLLRSTRAHPVHADRAAGDVDRRGLARAADHGQQLRASPEVASVFARTAGPRPDRPGAARHGRDHDRCGRATNVASMTWDKLVAEIDGKLVVPGMPNIF
jgi:hypothetical protein